MSSDEDDSSLNKHFVETLSFTAWVHANPPEWDELYSQFQRSLSSNPQSGKVIKGTGGLRKARMADPKRGKGKRGGARVIYLHVPEVDWIFMIDIYDKGQKEDLLAEDRKALAELAVEYRELAIRLNRKGDGEKKP